MNKVTRIGIVAAVVVAVAGGSYAAYAAASITPDPTASESPSASAAPSAVPSSESTPANIVASPSDTPSPTPTDEKPDAAEIFLHSMHNQATFGMESTSDAEYLDYAHAACAQLRDGIPLDDVKVLSGNFAGEPSNGYNNRSIVGIASETFCTDYSQTHPDF